MSTQVNDLPRSHPAPRSSGGPFATVKGPAGLIVAGMVATGVWAVAGPWLPGGRWVSVHLFTLGVLTPAIVAFSAHFAGSLLMTRESVRPPVALLAVGVVGTLIGVSADVVWVSGIAASVTTAAVMLNYWRLRTARKAALQPRWVWMVRRWERAHGAFAHGAVLGILLAVHVLPGSWWMTTRMAHLHVMLLGWGGVTLMATATMFAPMALRTQMPKDAPDIIGRWTNRSATALTVAVVALLLSAFDGVVGTGLRVVSAAGLAVYAVGAVAVTRVLWRTRAGAPVRRWPGTAIVLGVGAIAGAVTLDVPVVAAAAWRFHDALGVLTIGGLLLAIVGALAAVAPWLLGPDRAGRDAVRDRLDVAGPVRVAVLAGGIGLAAAGAVWRTTTAGAWAVRTGWGLVILAIAVTLGLALSARRLRA